MPFPVLFTVLGVAGMVAWMAGTYVFNMILERRIETTAHMLVPLRAAMSLHEDVQDYQTPRGPSLDISIRSVRDRLCEYVGNLLRYSLVPRELADDYWRMGVLTESQLTACERWPRQMLTGQSRPHKRIWEPVLWDQAVLVDLGHYHQTLMAMIQDLSDNITDLHSSKDRRALLKGLQQRLSRLPTPIEVDTPFTVILRRVWAVLAWGGGTCFLVGIVGYFVMIG